MQHSAVMKAGFVLPILGLALSALSALSACGDLGAVDVALTFPDATTQSATRKLIFVTREAPRAGTGCDTLWTMQSNGLAEKRTAIDYPNRNDLVASDVDLTKYPKLTLLVYAYPSRDTSVSSPIAG